MNEWKTQSHKPRAHKEWAEKSSPAESWEERTMRQLEMHNKKSRHNYRIFIIFSSLIIRACIFYMQMLIHSTHLSFGGWLLTLFCHILELRVLIKRIIFGKNMRFLKLLPVLAIDFCLMVFIIGFYFIRNSFV